MRRALVLLCCLAGCAGARQAQRQGGPAADFSLPDLNGQQVRLSALQGKVVLLDFWATWCDPCMKELPELVRLQREMGDKGVVVVAVSLDKERQGALETVQRLGLQQLTVVLDPEGKVAEQYSPPRMPTSYVVDRQGLVRFVNEGFEGAADVTRLRTELSSVIQ